MRRIYGFIILSGLVLTGVSNTASLAFKSGLLARVNSDIPSPIIAETDNNFCKRGGDQREGCLKLESQVLLSLNQSKPGFGQSVNRMPRGSGRIDILGSEQDNRRMPTKEDARGSGRRKLTNSDQDSDSVQSNSQEHRGSGRVEV